MRDELPADGSAEAELLPVGGPTEAVLSVVGQMTASFALPVGGPTEAAEPLILTGFFV